MNYIDIEFTKGDVSKVSAQQVNGSLELKLLNTIINQPINGNVFSLTIPKGVDVIDETK